jgi:hypothetical protein
MMFGHWHYIVAVVQREFTADCMSRRGRAAWLDWAETNALEQGNIHKQARLTHQRGTEASPCPDGSPLHRGESGAALRLGPEDLPEGGRWGVGGSLQQVAAARCALSLELEPDGERRNALLCLSARAAAAEGQWLCYIIGYSALVSVFSLSVSITISDLTILKFIF